MASGLFTTGISEVIDGTINLMTDVIQIILVTSAYTFDPDTLVVDAGGASDILDAELTVTGYTGGWGGSGRKALASKTVTADLVNDRSVFDAADPSTWTALSAGETIAAAIIIKKGASNDTTSRPIAYLDLTDTPTNGNDFTVQFDATGIFYFGDGGASLNAIMLQGVAIDSTLDTTDGYVLTYVSANSDLELLPASGGGGGFGQLSPLSPPEGTIALPTWINQGGATTTDESDGLYLLGVADSNNQIRGKYHSYTAPKTITAAFLPFLRGNGNSNVGISITDGTTTGAKAINFEFIQSSAVAKVAVEYWTAVAGGSVSNTPLVEMSMHHSPMIWMQIEDNNTNLIFRLSSDGIHFPIVVLTVGRTAHLTPSHVGIMTNAFGATVLSAMKCLHWSIA